MNYHNITHDDMNNGDGLRVVLWVAGCEHHCKDCHNKVTWDANGGTEFTMRDAEEIFRDLEKDYVAGITFSGGDPLHPANREQVFDLIDIIKHVYPSKTVWVYTGYTWEEIMQIPELVSMLRTVDVLVDGRFNPALKSVTYPWAGSTNQRVIDVQQTFKKGRVILHASN
jgi:anaerobic ribonucleoside-triphosphate reductase activating protein